MVRTCTVCTHKSLDEINRLLLSGEPYRDIAGQFDLSKTAIARHKESHIPEVLLKSTEIKEIVSADSLLQKVRDEEDFVREMRVLAAAEGDIKVALSAVDRALKCIELYARVLGIIKNEPTVNLSQVNMNIYQSPEWSVVGDALARILAPYPELRREVATEFIALERGTP